MNKRFSLGNWINYSIPTIHEHISHFNTLMNAPYTDLFDVGYYNLKQHLELLYCLFRALSTTDDREDTLHLSIILSIKVHKLKLSVFNEKPNVHVLYALMDYHGSINNQIIRKDKIAGIYHANVSLAFDETNKDFDRTLAYIIQFLDLHTFHLMARNIYKFKFHNNDRSPYIKLSINSTRENNDKVFLRKFNEAYGDELKHFLNHETYKAMKTKDNAFFTSMSGRVEDKLQRIWEEMALRAYSTIILDYFTSSECSSYFECDDVVGTSIFGVRPISEKVYRVNLPYSFNALDYGCVSDEGILEEFRRKR